jgi:hypothetical protein
MSCVSSRQSNKEYLEALNTLKTHFEVIKGEKPSLYTLNFKSKDKVQQHKEFEELFNAITFEGKYECLIGLDKKEIIKILGAPTIGAETNSAYMFYYIRIRPECGKKGYDSGDLEGNIFDYCNFLEFKIKDNKISQVSFDPTELW